MTSDHPNQRPCYVSRVIIKGHCYPNKYLEIFLSQIFLPVFLFRALSTEQLLHLQPSSSSSAGAGQWSPQQGHHYSLEISFHIPSWTPPISPEFPYGVSKTTKIFHIYPRFIRVQHIRACRGLQRVQENQRLW